MKRFLLCCLMLLCFVGCGTVHNVQTDTKTYGYSQMYYTMDKQLCAYQVDSMITVDKLEKLNKWHKMTYTNNMTQYMFIKSLENNNELIYTVAHYGRDTVYRCTKRITNEIKK